jgi:rubrerythrin
MAELTDDLKSILEIRQLSEQELIRAIRVGIKGEIDAIHLYDMIAEATSNEKVSKIMKDVAKEERVHVGEFMRVLQEVFPEEMEDYNKGASEAEEIFSEGEYPTEDIKILDDKKRSLMNKVKDLEESLEKENF